MTLPHQGCSVDSIAVVAPRFVSFAQNAEDVVLWRALRGVLEGVYVDVGAADPVVDSVTKAFSDRGWRGVNVEPVPVLAEALRVARPRDTTFAVAAGAAASEQDLYVVDGTGLSTLLPEEAALRQAEGFTVERIEVPVRPLNELLAEAGLEGQPIHFCKVDVEGDEPEVLAGFDLAHWQPWVLVVEAVRPQSGEPAASGWEGIVLGAGYHLCLFDGLNRFYAAPSHPELIAALSAPASVLDLPYVTHRQLQLEEGLERHTRQLTERLQAADGRAADLEAHAARADASAAVAAGDAVRWRQRYLDSLTAEAALEQEAEALRAELAATLRTFSWRLTAPLRRVRAGSGGVKRFVVQVETTAGRSRSTVRAVQWGQRRVPVVRRLRHRLRPELRADHPTAATAAAMAALAAAPTPVEQLRPTTRALDAPMPTPAADQALAARLLTAASLLDGQAEGEGGLAASLDRFERAVGGAAVPAAAAAWLALVAFTATYPTELELDRQTQRLLLDGPAALVEALHGEARQRAPEDARHARLRVVTGGVAVDVTHTASHDLHTGIQRVVRETVSRWLDDHRPVLYGWDYEARAPLPLPAGEVAHFQRWRSHVHAADQVVIREPVAEVDEILVPWRSVVVLPELVAEPMRTDGYRALVKAGIATHLSMVGYDLIPITISETVTPGMSANFANYLSAVKYADRVSCISLSSAREFEGFCGMLSAQGLKGPHIVGHPLPSESPDVQDEALAAARELLALDSQPLVLVVGSHEPRKNHATVLLAAERLWRSGRTFHLVFIGGSGWSSQGFDDLVVELAERGRPVQVLKRADEDTLWAAYRLARFTVFPSLAEGFGLPVAESLSSGTPAITSDFGSLAEIAEVGGCLTVDPRDPEAVEAAMRDLLDDDTLLERLANQAAERTWKTWDHYAKETWDHLTGR